MSRKEYVPRASIEKSNALYTFTAWQVCKHLLGHYGMPVAELKQFILSLGLCKPTTADYILRFMQRYTITNTRGQGRAVLVFFTDFGLKLLEGYERRKPPKPEPEE